MDNQVSDKEFMRIANNFYNEKNIAVDLNRIGIDSHFINYYISHQQDVKKKFKVALVGICLNPFYWPYVKEMIEGAKKLFLPGHNVDLLFWSDIPNPENIEAFKRAEEQLTKDLIAKLGKEIITQEEYQNCINQARTYIQTGIESSKKILSEAQLFSIEPIEWPFPTLMRYHTFLQQEEKLKEYDYIFYCDVDMKFVGVVGDEILGEGLTAAVHPMYYLDKKFIPPYEPNKDSAAYIPRPGQVIQELNAQGQIVPRFMPLYYAGGFQGGKAKDFIIAMQKLKQMIDQDLNKNYIPVWNDESVWNKYLFDNPPAISLTPAYVYPDSLINEYYIPIWGQNFVPKLITLTKKHSLTTQGGEAVQKTIQQFKALQK